MSRIIISTMVGLILFLQCKEVANENVTCSVGAVTSDEDLNGLNVRESINGKVIDALPKDTMLGVVGYKNGWFKIEDASYSYEEKFDGLAIKWKHNTGSTWVERKYFNKEAWVNAKHLKTYLNTRADLIYQEPDSNSPVLTHFKDQDSIMYPVQLLECKNDWVKIDYKGNKGWVNSGTCPNPHTTCS
ncbi:SH3 domain-containing protein [Leptospira sp. 201903071]|uniref:SH3 domain-containing protein n=1 Tax=Leptospira ainazelensis TaxID=2810034 RepID=UPI001962DEEF|nr:SH3 domain-containing protein [Leptospira ainazelensis]MBM9501228.1 SH3 domain-containing protein [Leptospira ainazelensis]